MKHEEENLHFLCNFNCIQCFRSRKHNLVMKPVA